MASKDYHEKKCSARRKTIVDILLLVEDSADEDVTLSPCKTADMF